MILLAVLAIAMLFLLSAYSRRDRLRLVYDAGYLLWKDKRAQMGVGGGVVGTIVGIMVSLLVAIIVIQNLIASQTPDTTWSEDANSSWDSLQSNIWVAITLLVIVPIIIGAVIILAYVRRGM